MGGEKGPLDVLPHGLTGSPPRGRGKATAPAMDALPSGITPAWAGKSAFLVGVVRYLWDHPRVGGEKRRLSECAQWAEGSPPRGRGKVKPTNSSRTAFRITPAWAGKRLFPWPVGALGGDHPRVGGEKINRLLSILICWGSPPRGRGKACVVLPEGGPLWITPAWAGKSPLVTRLYALAEDHPRVGGEKAAPSAAV